MFGTNKDQIKTPHQESPLPDIGPIEPEDRKTGKVYLLKWLFFAFVLIYIVLSSYYVPILTGLGRYLIVKHPLQPSDLIVSLAGGNIERGLATSDVYKEGYAKNIFLAREELPDGFELVKERGLDYPANIDLMVRMLQELGIPDSAITVSDGIVKSTFDEANVVKDLIKEKDYDSLIIVTSPTHSRRAWLIFKKIIGDDIRIQMSPSPYSEFKPEGWWKRRRYVREVIIEYQKLIYYTVKYLI